MVIGCEIHVQLATKTKLFSGMEIGTNIPNHFVSYIDIGYPGALPQLNKSAIDLATKACLALNCKVSKYIEFDRKHYSYPDLPSGFQITQFYYPIGTDGYLDINENRIHIKQIHIETDAGKLIHQGQYSYVDYNRCGVPLIEIVTQPDMSSIEECTNFIKELILILRTVNVSGCNLELGEFRVDVNISISNYDSGEKKLGTRVEIKNLNSLKAIEQAIEYEVKRQKDIITSGGSVQQQTRMFDSENLCTVAMRDKVNASDYGYIDDGNIPPLELDENYINSIKNSLPLLPQQKRDLYQKMNINNDLIEIIITDAEIEEYFYNTKELLISNCNKSDERYKILANILINEVVKQSRLCDVTISNSLLTPQQLAIICNLVIEDKISSKTVKILIEKSYTNELDVIKYINDNNLIKITDTKTIQDWINITLQNLTTNDKQKIIRDYTIDPKRSIAFISGQVLKTSNMSADPQIVSNLLLQIDIIKIVTS